MVGRDRESPFAIEIKFRKVDIVAGPREGEYLGGRPLRRADLSLGTGWIDEARSAVAPGATIE